MHLGNDRYVSVKTYKDQTRVDIRQYQKYGEKIYPTKLGVHLSGEQFTNFLSFLDDISSDIQKFRDSNKTEGFKYNIGDGLYVTASDGFALVHIRYYFQNELMPFPLPTKIGLALRFSEWNNLVSLIEEVQKRLN